MLFQGLVTPRLGGPRQKNKQIYTAMYKKYRMIKVTWIEEIPSNTTTSIMLRVIFCYSIQLHKVIAFVLIYTQLVLSAISLKLFYPPNLRSGLVNGGLMKVVGSFGGLGSDHQGVTLGGTIAPGPYRPTKS